jgi:hypothetical protein
VSALELQVHEGGVAFIPKRVEVLASDTFVYDESVHGNGDAATLRLCGSTEVVSYGWTALVPAHSRLRARVLRVAIRSCHESGINCRISGIRLQCTVRCLCSFTC